MPPVHETKLLHGWKVLKILESHVCYRGSTDVICDAAGVNASGTTFRSHQRGSRRFEALLIPDFLCLHD